MEPKTDVYHPVLPSTRNMNIVIAPPKAIDGFFFLQMYFLNTSWRFEMLDYSSILKVCLRRISASSITRQVRTLTGFLKTKKDRCRRSFFFLWRRTHLVSFFFSWISDFFFFLWKVWSIWKGLALPLSNDITPPWWILFL